MSETKNCPYCAEEIQEAAIACKHCNRPMPGHEREVPPPLSAAIEVAAVPEPKKKKGAWRWLLVGLLIVLVGGVAFLYFSGRLQSLVGRVMPYAAPFLDPIIVPCNMQAESFIEQVEALIDDWDDANQLAGSTSRIALSPVVGQLQEIRRRAADMEAPECARELQDLLLAHMDAVIKGYLLFMGDSDDDDIKTQFIKAEIELTKFMIALVELQTGESPND